MIMKKEGWKYGIARDALAFGSILFYIIVIVRAIIGKHMAFVYQVVIALAILAILALLIKSSNQHIARAVPLVAFTSMFYKDDLFTLFAVLLFIAMIFSAFYMKINKKEIFNGVVAGIMASAGAYFVAEFLV